MNAGLQPQMAKPTTPSLDNTIGSQTTMQPYEEEDQDSYQEANTGTDNILPGDLDTMPMFPLLKRKSAPKPSHQESESLTPSQNEAVQTLSNILASKPTGNQSNPQTNPHSSTLSDPLSRNTNTVLIGEKTYTQVFGNAIIDLINTHVIGSPLMIGLVLTHKDPEVLISKIILQILEDTKKDKAHITSMTSGFACIWNQQANSVVLP